MEGPDGSGKTTQLTALAKNLRALGYAVAETAEPTASTTGGLARDALSGFTEVSSIHTTNGNWDLVVELGTSDLIAFDQVLRRIRMIPGVTNSETSLLLATPRSVKARL